ncbi:MAG: hypothetical protein WCT35_08890 [Sideroxydans sp.]|jgi:hypothetical protein
MDKTVKISAYSAPTKGLVQPQNISKDKFVALELEQKQAQLDEERNKSLELLKNVVQLRESLKQEQAKAAEQEAKAVQLEAKLNKMVALEESQIAKRNAQIEEEKKYSLELMRTIEELKEKIKQEKARSADIADSGVQLEAKLQEIIVLEAKIKDLSGVLNKIISIAEAAKVVADK